MKQNTFNKLTSFFRNRNAQIALVFLFAFLFTFIFNFQQNLNALAGSIAVVLGIFFSFSTTIFVHLAMWKIPTVSSYQVKQISNGLNLMTKDCVWLMFLALVGTACFLYQSLHTHTVIVDSAKIVSLQKLWELFTSLILFTTFRYIALLVMHGLTLRRVSNEIAFRPEPF